MNWAPYLYNSLVYEIHKISCVRFPFIGWITTKWEKQHVASRILWYPAILFPVSSDTICNSSIAHTWPARRISANPGAVTLPAARLSYCTACSSRPLVHRYLSNYLFQIWLRLNWSSFLIYYNCIIYVLGLSCLLLGFEVWQPL